MAIPTGTRLRCAGGAKELACEVGVSHVGLASENRLHPVSSGYGAAGGGDLAMGGNALIRGVLCLEGGEAVQLARRDEVPGADLF